MTIAVSLLPGQPARERRFAADLAADVVGYGRQMEQDKARTFERLRAHRKRFFEPEIAMHHDRNFKLIGHGLSAEFLRRLLA